MIFMVMGLQAQPGIAQSVAVDTIQGAETVNFVLSPSFQGKNLLTIQALCTQTGGVSEGTLILEASVDGISYETLTTTDGFLYAYPNDTLTIANGAVGTWVLKDSPWIKYRLQGTGAANDSTKITIKYVYK